MSISETQAKDFLSMARSEGFDVSVRGEVVTISKTIGVNNNDGFCHCDTYAPMILSRAPLKGGSVWGTDGGSIGGAVALNTGRFVMNKSGSGKRFLKALQKLL
jgi:hypothetical protein